jgi:transposase InsO family protein
VVSGMPTFQFNRNNICKGCMLGKNIKKSFLVSNKRAKVILELIHSNVCGPISTSSLDGHVYYVIFIDDFSRKSWVYFMKSKNETFKNFHEFKALIENQTETHIRILRSNNGGEYESHQFEDFCKEEAIKRQLTVPYNPQQNGVAERKNITICEAAKAMMCD